MLSKAIGNAKTIVISVLVMTRKRDRTCLALPIALRVWCKKSLTAVEYARYHRASNGEEICERKSIHDVTTYLHDIKKGSTNVCVTFGRLFLDRSISVLKYS